MKDLDFMEPRNLKIKRSKSGVPCYWENMKHFSGVQRYSLVVSENNNNVIFSKTNGDRLTVLTENDYIIKLFIEGDNIDKKFKNINQLLQTLNIGMTVLKIDSISKYTNSANVNVVFRKNTDELLDDNTITNNEILKIVSNKLLTLSIFGE